MPVRIDAQGRAKLNHREGMVANKNGDARTAYYWFMRANALRPQEPVHIISAANMLVKIAAEDPASHAIEEAFLLYENAARLDLTSKQRQMVRT